MLEEPSLFVVYIDLKGAAHGAMIKAEDRAGAINCIEEAWNSNLLWHFKVYGENDSDDMDAIVKSANLPWSIESISQVISLTRMQKDLDRNHELLENRKKELVKNYSGKKDFRLVAHHGDLQLYASLGILREAHDSFKIELSDKGMKIPEIIDNDVFEIFEYTQKILKKLSEINHFHSSNGNNFYAMKPPCYTPHQFIDNLPKLEEIFTSYKTREEWLKLNNWS
jgi:hypothetical protein